MSRTIFSPPPPTHTRYMHYPNKQLTNNLDIQIHINTHLEHCGAFNAKCINCISYFTFLDVKCCVSRVFKPCEGLEYNHHPQRNSIRKAFNLDTLKSPHKLIQEWERDERHPSIHIPRWPPVPGPPAMMASKGMHGPWMHIHRPTCPMPPIALYGKCTEPWGPYTVGVPQMTGPVLSRQTRGQVLSVLRSSHLPWRSED